MPAPPGGGPSREWDCPVCALGNIPEDKAKCPQCDADLTCFKVLDSVPEASPSAQPRLAGRMLNAIVLVLCLGATSIPTAFLLHQIRQIESLAAERQACLSSMIDHLSARVEQLARVTIKAESPPPPEPRIFWSYTIAGRDTLWSLAERFYGSGFFYPVLLEGNPDLGAYSMEQGSKIEILEDAASARDIYRRYRFWRGRRLYWSYGVRQGDTLQSIALKFYNDEKKAADIARLNPGLELRPGLRIRLRLPYGESHGDGTKYPPTPLGKS